MDLCNSKVGCVGKIDQYIESYCQGHIKLDTDGLFKELQLQASSSNIRGLEKVKALVEKHKIFLMRINHDKLSNLCSKLSTNYRVVIEQKLPIIEEAKENESIEELSARCEIRLKRVKLLKKAQTFQKECFQLSQENEPSKVRTWGEIMELDYHNKENINPVTRRTNRDVF